MPNKSTEQQVAQPQGVLVVSDLHAGSIYGLLPPDFVKGDGSIAALNPGQTHLWNCWLHLCDYVSRLNIVAVVTNGDLIDGTQHCQRGTELSLPLLGDQALAATKALKLLKRKTPRAAWYVVSGTEYHDSKAGEHADRVAENLGCVPYDGPGTGHWARQILDLEIDGTILNFSHGISVASGFYRATAIDREGIWSALTGKEGKCPKADAVIRAHCHFYCHVEHQSKHIVIGPCWQLQTGYMRKNSAYRMVPDIGALIVWVTPEAKKAGEDPIRIQKILYNLPPVRTVKLKRQST